jgi:CRP-like cAMP-binding protein
MGEILVIIPYSKRFIVKSVGEVVGEYGLFTEEKRTATLIAKGMVEVLYLDYDRFERFLLAFPDSMYKLFEFAIRNLLKNSEI